MNAYLFVYDVQRVQIRHQVDRHDARPADMFADDMACGNKQIGAGAADRVGLGDPQARIGFLHHLVDVRSEEHTSELQSLMRISYAVFCLKKKKTPVNDIGTHMLVMSSYNA